jgi:threonine synthase
MKTLAFEICEQLTAQLGSPGLTDSRLADGARVPQKWRAPDWYVQSVSGGLGPLGAQKGFSELQKMGWIDSLPAIACIQAEGCSPMVQAWKRGQEVAEPVRSPHTHIATLATGDPGRTYTLLYQRMKAGGGGLFEMVSDEETYRMIHILAKLEGISVEPAAAVAFAGITKMVRTGQIKPSDVVVVNCTGHTMPIEMEVLGDHWARSVAVPTATPTALPPQNVPVEGLLSALNRVTSDRFSRVAIVDDHPDARRLIRRILQSQGNYELMEACNGREAIELAQKEIPDLMILDLMMPELDGFTVLDALRADPHTAHIPVIVVTAKELTGEEKERLQGQVYSLLQKGEFMNDEFMEEVRSLVD